MLFKDLISLDQSRRRKFDIGILAAPKQMHLWKLYLRISLANKYVFSTVLICQNFKNSIPLSTTFPTAYTRMVFLSTYKCSFRISLRYSSCSKPPWSSSHYKKQKIIILLKSTTRNHSYPINMQEVCYWWTRFQYLGMTKNSIVGMKQPSPKTYMLIVSLIYVYTY